jgi:prolyl-tRNA synthetase
MRMTTLFSQTLRSSPADADLIGLPLRVTLGAKSLAQGGVEVKRRTHKESALVPPNEAVAHAQAEIAALFSDLRTLVIDVPFRE